MKLRPGVPLWFHFMMTSCIGLTLFVIVYLGGH